MIADAVTSVLLVKCCQIVRQITPPRLAISKGGTAKPSKCSDLSCKTLEFGFKICYDTPKPEFGRDFGCGRGRALHLSATPNLPNLRAVIKVCRESPAKLSQGTRLRGGAVGCGQYEVRGGKGSFPSSTTCQTGRQGREGFFKKLEDGKEKNERKQAELRCYIREIFERAVYKLSFLCAWEDKKERVVTISFHWIFAVSEVQRLSTFSLTFWHPIWARSCFGLVCDRKRPCLCAGEGDRIAESHFVVYWWCLSCSSLWMYQSVCTASV